MEDVYKRQLHIHRGINGKGELLLLIVKDFRGWEVQFPHNAVDGKVGGIYCPVFLFDFQIPLVFLYQTTGGFDEVIVFHQRLDVYKRQIVDRIYQFGENIFFSHRFQHTLIYIIGQLLCGCRRVQLENCLLYTSSSVG